MKSGLQDYIKNHCFDSDHATGVKKAWAFTNAEFRAFVAEAFRPPKEGSMCQIRKPDGLWYDFKIIDGKLQEVGLSEFLMCGPS